MPNMLLLYDTNESDLARDFRDMLTEMNIGIIMIPLSANKGYALAEKEKHYFKEAAGALFVITPGSERLGKFFPSPSVNHEMGQAQARFANKPECIIYFVDDGCNMPAINQQAYIQFNRNNIRPSVGAITQLIRDLKSAGLFRTNPIPEQVKKESKQFDIDAFMKRLNATDINIIPVLLLMSNRDSGYISDGDLSKILINNYKLTIQQVNFIKRDLSSLGVVIHNVTNTPFYMNSWWLSDYGWMVVRAEIDKKTKADKNTIQTLIELMSPPLARGGGLSADSGGLGKKT